MEGFKKKSFWCTMHMISETLSQKTSSIFYLELVNDAWISHMLCVNAKGLRGSRESLVNAGLGIQTGIKALLLVTLNRQVYTKDCCKMCLSGAQILYGQVLYQDIWGALKTNIRTNLLFSYVYFQLMRMHSVCGQAKIIKYFLWPEYIFAITYLLYSSLVL